MNEQIKKDTYTYYFADGTKSVVTAQEVGQEWINILWDMDEKESKRNRAETRRHVSIDELVEMNVEPSYEDEYSPEDILEHISDPDLHYAVSMLTEPQKKLLYRRFVQGFTVTDIAEIDGVAVCSISKRFERIYKKMENFLPDRQLLALPVAISVGVKNEPPANLKKEQDENV